MQALHLPRGICITMLSSMLSNRLIPFILLSILLLYSSTALAGVTVYDSITIVNKTVQLRAITKGRFFPEGGRLVRFYIDGSPIGTTLSGGDGYAFIGYLPSSPGLKQIRVEAGPDADEGILLVSRRQEKVILIEIERTLLNLTFRDLFKPLKGSREALTRLSKRFRIIYLTTMMGIGRSREWLREKGFPSSVILKWEGSGLLDEIRKTGIQPYAIIGSPDVLSEALEIKKRFSLEDTEEGTTVKDWDELLKQLDK